MQHPKLEHIEVFRGVAVLLVLLFHLSTPGFSYAYLGVDSFFVISGFLMALLYGGMDDRAAVGNFYRRRLARLLPAYFCVLLISTVAAAAIVLPHEYADASRYTIWSAVLAPNVGFWMDADYFDSAYFHPVLNFWSLGVELQFYLVFPLIVYLHRRVPWLTFVITMASLALFLMMSEVSPKTAFFQTPARIWQFMAGFYVARWRLRALPPLLRNAALPAVVGLILAAPYLRFDAAFLAAAVTALTALCLISGMTKGFESAPPARFFKLLGKYSYSIYLVHYPVIVFLAYEPFGATNLALVWPGEHFAAVVLIAVLSFALFHLVEKPLRSKRSRRFVIGTMTAGAALSGATAAVASPLASADLSPKQELAVSAWFDRLPYRCPKMARILHPLEESCQISGEKGRGWLLVGDSHADVLKDVLRDEIQRSGGGRLRLMVSNDAVGQGLTPREVLDEARDWNIDTVVVHSTAGHMDADAIAALAKQAVREQVKVVVVAPVPSPRYNVPKRIFISLQDGEPIKLESSLTSYVGRHRRLLRELKQIPYARIFYPADILCQPRCAVQDNTGTPLYIDGGHLSQTGVETLRPVLRRIASI